MKFNETEKFGLITFLINIILTLFLLSSKDDFKIMFIVAIISNIVALGFNVYAIKISKKRLYNTISIALNIIFAFGVVVYGLYKLHII